jgi:hypothetical protein
VTRTGHAARRVSENHSEVLSRLAEIDVSSHLRKAYSKYLPGGFVHHVQPAHPHKCRQCLFMGWEGSEKGPHVCIAWEAKTREVARERREECYGMFGGPRRTVSVGSDGNSVLTVQRLA